jgi:hypothetical protein
MAKLKNIIKQLSDHDYQTLYQNLAQSGADKSAYLLKSLREQELTDAKIMTELEVNNNAYYTLRSRLNQKIEEYLLQQIESPRTDLLKKVVNINEVVFTKKRAISVATLKKLEKELLDYDLSNELTVVYKALKKLHIHSPEHFHYSQLYNRHVAYMLAIDKAEDILADYFRKFGEYSLTGDENDRLGLNLLMQEIQNISKLYDSHRLYVYQSCITVFHRLFVEKDIETQENDDAEPIEDILNEVQKHFTKYEKDSIYYHLNIVFEFLKLEYYNHYKVYKKAEKFYEDVNDSLTALLTNYGWYTYPAQFLHTKIERALRNHTLPQLYEESFALFEDYEEDVNNTPTHVEYVTYRALCCYFAGKYSEAARWLNDLLNEVSLKKYPYALLELKSLLALQYALLKDQELFNQLINSIQRQIRLLGKEKCGHIVAFLKMLKNSANEAKKLKSGNATIPPHRIEYETRRRFSPTRYIIFDEKLLEQIFS